MASDEQKKLAQFVKDVHASLRKTSQEVGVEKAWIEHCSKTEMLKQYALSMQKLATEHWEPNCADLTKPATSRIEWAAQFCYQYFLKNNFENCRQKEIVIADKINIEIKPENFSKKPKLLDVGSCYNPFRIYEFLQVFPIDLCPANNTVMQCDFLKLEIGSESNIDNGKVLKLLESSFEIVTFCFLLEYIPSSELRIQACEKAYSLLKQGGLLIINTPDSKHVGANCKIIKCWRYALALIGFTRIKYEKFSHMHCMAFRKALDKRTAVRWAELHKEPYMEFALKIPQDSNTVEKNMQNHSSSSETELSAIDFCEMPFYE